MLPFLWSVEGGAEEPELLGYFESLIDEKRLYEHPTWLRLLHYPEGRKRSSINSPEFFLSEKGGSDPEAEMRATLEAYFEEGPLGDLSARCRFPGRYFWLNSQLELPGFELAPETCSKLKHWDLLRKTESISMYWVSGYFGNPASSFGHALLKLNSKGKEGTVSQLLDLTVNFGALVPENELMLLYIVRRLTGGYQAGFSDQFFFTQDQVYSRTEFRDIWDYKLNLSEEQRTLLILHLWEVIGKKYTYYFAKENCAFRLATLLEVVLEEKLVDGRPWYVPVDLFNRLDTIDQARKERGEAELIASVEPIPSSRRILYARFADLTSKELGVANELIRKGHPFDFSEFDRLSQQEQTDVLDALLAYYNYKELSQIREPDPEIQAAKREVLLRRLRLPARALRSAEISLSNPPTESAPPLFLSAGVGSNEAGDIHTRLTFSPFSQESLAYRSDIGSEMSVLRVSVGGGDDFFLDRVDLLDIRKLSLDRVPVEGEKSASWLVNVGGRRTKEESAYPNEWYAGLGMGKSLRLFEGHAVSAFAGTVVSSLGDPVRFRPELQWTGKFGEFGYDAYVSTEIGESEVWSFDWGASLQLNIDRNFAFRVSVSSDPMRRALGGLIWSW